MTSYDFIYRLDLYDAGNNRTKIILLVHELRPDLSLAEARWLVDNAPQIIAEGVERERKDRALRDFRREGAIIEAEMTG